MSLGPFIPSITSRAIDSIHVNPILHASRTKQETTVGPHYATTLRHRRERFMSNLERVRRPGYGAEFIRMREFYLCYCEGGFAEGQLGMCRCC